MWLVLTMLLYPWRARSRVSGCAVAVVAAALTLAFPAAAVAQGDSDRPLIGTTVAVENTRTTPDASGQTNSETASAGPNAISGGVEFPACCAEGKAGLFDIDVASDRITMTWVGPASEAGVVEEGTVDKYEFSFASPRFRRAFADHSQLLIPEVSFTDDTITVTIAEGDEVGPGRPIVVLVTPFAPNTDGDTSVDGSTKTSTKTSTGTSTETPTDSTAPDDEAAPRDSGLARTGNDGSLWLAILGTILLGSGLFVLGAGLRADS